MAVVCEIPDTPESGAWQQLFYKNFNFCNSLYDLSMESINPKVRIEIDHVFSKNKLVTFVDGDVFLIPETEKEFIKNCFTRKDPKNHVLEGMLLNCIDDKGNVIDTKAIFFEFLKRQLFPYSRPISSMKDCYFPIHSNGNVYYDLKPCESSRDIAKYIVKNKLGCKLRINSLLDVQVNYGRGKDRTANIHCFEW